MNKFNSEKPYNDLPLLPPKEWMESIGLLKKCISARSALAELKGVCETIPNPGLLIRSIGLQEAKTSSEIENILTTNDNLYQSLDSIDIADPATKEVLRYQEALMVGVNEIKDSSILSTNLFCKISSKIKQRTMGIRNMTGTKISNGAGKVIYTPPEGENLIREKLANLEKFIHMDKNFDPLVKMAIMHYQFEAIHPFVDGNGRTGRILNILFLLQQGLLTLPILYLSKFVIEHKNEYYTGLLKVTEKSDWESWILFMLAAIENTAIDTQKKIVSIKQSMENTHSKLKEKLPSLATKDLVELLFYYPYCKIKFLEREFKITRQTAASRLKSLEEIGILKPIKLGREVYYVNRQLMDILIT